MEKEETRQQHYELPVSSKLENDVAKEYLAGYSRGMYLDNFGDFLFSERAAPRFVKDESNPNVDTNKYDTAFLGLYSLALAKAELAASAATPETKDRLLEKLLQVEAKNDFFLNELSSRENWQRYVNLESVAAWYDDKRRAFNRGLIKKGLPAEAIRPIKKRSWKWLKYALGIPFAATLLAGAVFQIALYFQAAGLKEEARKEIRAAKDEFRIQADTLLSEKEQEYAVQLYEFADRIDPPKDENDKAEKRNLPLAERIGTALSVYEDKLIAKGEIKYRQIADENANMVGEDIIRRINNGEIDISQILTRYVGQKKKEEK